MANPKCWGTYDPENPFCFDGCNSADSCMAEGQTPPEWLADQAEMLPGME